MAASRWADRRLWVEVFALLNLGGLAGDILLAHSMNFFRERAEYVPLVVSVLGPLMIAAGILAYVRGRVGAWGALGHVVGWASVVVGIVGTLLHLDSSFFQVRTLSSLVYSAPFAAPLAYTGLGLLLIMNRMVEARTEEWALWVLLLALGGYIGNFVFSITDHAQNAFYFRAEWVAVVMGAMGVGFLFSQFIGPARRESVVACAAVMGAGAVVGLIGLYFHASADLRGTDAPIFSRVVYGAPVFAPLLFVDMGILAGIGLWARVHVEHGAPAKA